MNRFLSQRSCFLSADYSRKYHGPVFRGKCPLSHQSQAIARDIDASEIAASRIPSFHGAVLSDREAADFMGRTNCLPYSYFITVNGMSHTAFMTHAEAQAWADAYGLGNVPPIPAEGILSFELTLGGQMQPLRVDLSTGILSPQDFAKILLRERAAA